MIKDFVQLESDTITEKPIKIPFDFPNKENLPKGKNPGDCIIINPITVRTWVRIKPLLLSIEEKEISILIEKKEIKPDAEIIKLVSKYDEILLEIVYLGIHNKIGDMPKWFKEVLKDNCTWKDIYILLNAILFRIGFNPFCKSITTATNVSPMDEQEMIAAQKNLESWKIPQLVQ